MSLSRKVVTRVFQLSFRTNVLNYKPASCSSLLRQHANYFYKLQTSGNIITANLSTKTVHLHRPARAMRALSPLDPSSNSRPELAIIKHISLTLKVDFGRRVLVGDATLNFDVLKDIDDLLLDVSNLNIESIETDGGTGLEYKVGEHIPNFGSKLTILLPNQVKAGEKNPTTGTSFDTKNKNDQKLNAGSATSTEQKIGAIDLNQTCIHCMAASSGLVENKQSSDIAHSAAGSTFVLPKATRSETCLLPARATSSNREKFPCLVPSTNVEDCVAGCTCKLIGLNENRLKIRIKYTTDPSASALQWLDATQTSGKQHPYLFSQCQPIHARSILPCQDTPLVKFTYDAEVSAPSEFTVLMSALRGEVKNNKTYFNQPMPLPSYLVAIAVGVLESRTLGPRSKVWTEKEEIERSAWEFADTEKYLQAAERLCGPYEWSQYDLLVLPPSFPYGGMENPCLTFVTPTLLAGDRSQAEVIIHEIMHSWTGNLVTNRNFEHFWLNEGFTVFLERKVDASFINDPVEARRTRDFHSLLGLQELVEAVKTLGDKNPMTDLVPSLDGVHPDDAFSSVPYEKGSLFLRYLEDMLGGAEVFDDFLRSYLSKYRKTSIDTGVFQNYLLEYFKDNDQLKNINWDAWLHTSGMPPIIPNYDTTMTKAITNLINKIDAGNMSFSYDDVKTFTPHQIIHYLQQLIERPPLPKEHLRNIGAAYKIIGNNNTEILFRWSRLCVRSKDESALPDVFKFLNSNGRMKYVRPLYRDLYAWENVRQQAIDNFLKEEKNMMHVSAYTIKKDLHLSE